MLFQRHIPEWGKLVLNAFSFTKSFGLPETHDTVVTSSKNHRHIGHYFDTFWNRIKRVFGAFMLLMTFDETMSNDFSWNM